MIYRAELKMPALFNRRLSVGGSCVAIFETEVYGSSADLHSDFTLHKRFSSLRCESGVVSHYIDAVYELEFCSCI